MLCNTCNTVSQILKPTNSSQLNQNQLVICFLVEHIDHFKVFLLQMVMFMLVLLLTQEISRNLLLNLWQISARNVRTDNPTITRMCC